MEKREDFTRNNVLHLWPFVIKDLKKLGAKILYPKFCLGNINHISKCHEVLNQMHNYVILF